MGAGGGKSKKTNNKKRCGVVRCGGVGDEIQKIKITKRETERERERGGGGGGTGFPSKNYNILYLFEIKK